MDELLMGLAAMGPEDSGFIVSLAGMVEEYIEGHSRQERPDRKITGTKARVAKMVIEMGNIEYVELAGCFIAAMGK